MKILITGGLGYIGSKLTEHLRHDEITVVDNLHTQRYCSLFNRLTDYKFIEDDFINLSEDVIKEFDYVIHLAAIADAAKSAQQKDIIKKVNVDNTIAFFKQCSANGVRIIFPSSTSVYGMSTDVVYEDDNKYLNPQSVYANGKILVEEALHLNQSDSSYVVLRFGTICGVSAGMRFQTCVNKFCYQATFGQPLTVWRQNLNMVRPYLSLLDAISTIQFTINHWKKMKGQTYNVVTNNLSLQNVLDLLEKYVAYLVDLTDCPLLNQYSYDVNVDKIKKLGMLFNDTIEPDIKDIITLLKAI